MRRMTSIAGEAALWWGSQRRVQWQWTQWDRHLSERVYPPARFSVLYQRCYCGCDCDWGREWRFSNSRFVWRREV